MNVRTPVSIVNTGGSSYSLSFPIKHSPLFGMIADFIHCYTVIQSAVLHDEMNGF
jgi:hypothetical protein